MHQLLAVPVCLQSLGQLAVAQRNDVPEGGRPIPPAMLHRVLVYLRRQPVQLSRLLAPQHPLDGALQI